MKFCRAERRFRTTLRALRDECPTAMGFPVRVRRSSRHDGYYFGRSNVGLDNKSFIILLRTRVIDEKTDKVRSVMFAEMQDTLMHEWAHCMAWTPEGHPSVTDHDASWGVAYAKAYQAVIGD